VRKLIFVFVVLLIPVSIGLGLFDCGGEKVISDPVYSFSGTVRDTLTGFPIDSAWIREGDSTSTYVRYSDTIGNYNYSSIRFGSYNVNIFCGKVGYKTKSISFYLDRDIRNVDFYLNK